MTHLISQSKHTKILGFDRPTFTLNTKQTQFKPNNNKQTNTVTIQQHCNQILSLFDLKWNDSKNWTKENEESKSTVRKSGRTWRSRGRWGRRQRCCCCCCCYWWSCFVESQLVKRSLLRWILSSSNTSPRTPPPATRPSILLFSVSLFTAAPPLFDSLTASDADSLSVHEDDSSLDSRTRFTLKWAEYLAH